MNSGGEIFPIICHAIDFLSRFASGFYGVLDYVVFFFFFICWIDSDFWSRFLHLVLVLLISRGGVCWLKWIQKKEKKEKTKEIRSDF